MNLYIIFLIAVIVSLLLKMLEDWAWSSGLPLGWWNLFGHLRLLAVWSTIALGCYLAYLIFYGALENSTLHPNQSNI
jgi:hypothetical protein